MKEVKLKELGFFKNIKNELEKAMEEKKVIKVFDEVSLKDAEKDRKEMKDLIDKTERFRIDFNKEFTKTIKDLYIPINKVIEQQDEQIQAWNDKLDKEKLKEVEIYFETLKSPVNLERLMDKRYFNKTFKLQEIEQDSRNQVEKIKADINIVKMINDSPRLLELYFQELDITNAKELFDKENNNKVEIEAIENNLNKYTLNFETDADTYLKIERFIQALGIKLHE